MVKVRQDELKRTSATLEANLSPQSILDLLSREGFTLIFPWGSSPVSLRRSLNYLRYCMDLPQEARGTAILRLLGLMPYRRSWWTQVKERKQRYLRTHQVASTRRIERQRTGTGFIENT